MPAFSEREKNSWYIDMISMPFVPEPHKRASFILCANARNGNLSSAVMDYPHSYCLYRSSIVRAKWKVCSHSPCELFRRKNYGWEINENFQKLYFNFFSKKFLGSNPKFIIDIFRSYFLIIKSFL